MMTPHDEITALLQEIDELDAENTTLRRLLRAVYGHYESDVRKLPVFSVDQRERDGTSHCVRTTGAGTMDPDNETDTGLPGEGDIKMTDMKPEIYPACHDDGCRRHLQCRLWLERATLRHPGFPSLFPYDIPISAPCPFFQRHRQPIPKKRKEQRSMRTRQIISKLARAGYTVSTVKDTPPYGCRLTAWRGSAKVISYSAPTLHQAASVVCDCLLSVPKERKLGIRNRQFRIVSADDHDHYVLEVMAWHGLDHPHFFRLSLADVASLYDTAAKVFEEIERTNHERNPAP
jgi:hypothetical protein